MEVESKPASAKEDVKPKRPSGEDKSSDKKVWTKGKRGAKDRWAEQQNADLPAENGDSQGQSVASEVQEKEDKPD